MEKTTSAWPGVADNAGLAGSEILSVVVDVWRWTARVLLRRGATTEQVIGKIPALESGLGLRPGSMRVFPDGTRADRFIRGSSRMTRTPSRRRGRAGGHVGDKPVEIGLSEDGRSVSCCCGGTC